MPSSTNASFVRRTHSPSDGFTATPLSLPRASTMCWSGPGPGAPLRALGGRDSGFESVLSAVEQLDAEFRAAITILQENAQGEIEDVVAQARGEALVSIGAGITRRIETYFPGADYA